MREQQRIVNCDLAQLRGYSAETWRWNLDRTSQRCSVDGWKFYITVGPGGVHLSDVHGWFILTTRQVPRVEYEVESRRQALDTKEMYQFLDRRVCDGDLLTSNEKSFPQSSGYDGRSTILAFRGI